MKSFKDYNIPFVGLKQGTHQFEYQIDKAFFKKFEYDEFNDVEVDILLKFEKKPTLLELHFSANGYVNVFCDVTNEAYNQNIKGTFNLVVKFGQDYNDDNEDILILPHGEYEINVAQYIYELIILSVPVKRVHPGIEDGTLHSEILNKLEELSPNTIRKVSTTEEIDPRWENLKKLLTDKKH